MSILHAKTRIEFTCNDKIGDEGARVVTELLKGTMEICVFECYCAQMNIIIIKRPNMYKSR